MQTNASSTRLRVTAKSENLVSIRRFVEEATTALGVDPITIADTVLAVDEAASNIIIHGYRSQQGTIEIGVKRKRDELMICLRDEASPFDPTTVPPPDLTLPPEERAMEGMGIYLMRRSTDEMSHRITLQQGNELTLVRKGIGT